MLLRTTYATDAYSIDRPALSMQILASEFSNPDPSNRAIKHPMSEVLRHIACKLWKKEHAPKQYGPNDDATPYLLFHIFRLQIQLVRVRWQVT